MGFNPDLARKIEIRRPPIDKSSARPRAADHDLIFTMTNVLAVFRIRCGRQQLKKKPPGRSSDGSFRNCRHGAGSIALLIRRGRRPQGGGSGPSSQGKLAGTFAASANPYN